MSIIEEVRKSAAGKIDVLLQVAEFDQRAKRYPEAEAVLREALALEPKNLRVLFQLGASIERQKRHEPLQRPPQIVRY